MITLPPTPCAIAKRSRRALERTQADIPADNLYFWIECVNWLFFIRLQNFPLEITSRQSPRHLFVIPSLSLRYTFAIPSLQHCYLFVSVPEK